MLSILKFEISTQPTLCMVNKGAQVKVVLYIKGEKSVNQNMLEIHLTV